MAALKKLLLLFPVLLLLCLASDSDAAFSKKKQSEEIVNPVAGGIITPPTIIEENNSKVSYELRDRQNSSSALSTDNKPNQEKSGWEGIVALCCLVSGLLVPLAIVFGAFGMRSGRKHRGMAKVAFILGIVVLSVAITVALAVSGAL